MITLSDFAEALEAVKQGWPDAPGLPDGYHFRDLRGIGTVLYFQLPPASADLVAKDAAVALCCTTAMRVMLHYRRYNADKPMIGFRHPPGHKEGVEFFHGDESCMVADIESACLAALQAIAWRKA